MGIDPGQTFAIDRDGHSTISVSPHGAKGLRPPPLPVPESLTVSVSQLAAAIGRSVCSRTAPASLVQSQVTASLSALAEVCAIEANGLRVTKIIGHLNETKRNAIAHDLGAGMASLIMQDMGYAWAGLAEDHIHPSPKNGFASRKRPDLLFDAGGGVNEYIAVEAKGGTPTYSGWAGQNLNRRMTNACTGQVANVLGATSKDGGLISRGLATGLLGIAGGPAATFRVFEANPPAPPSRPLRGVSAAVSFPDGLAPMPLIALRHYVGVLRVFGAHHTANRLLRRILNLTGRDELGEFIGSDEPRDGFRIRFRGKDFITGFPQFLPELGWRSAPWPMVFAISEIVLRFIQNEMMDFASDRIGERLRLPTEDLSRLYTDTRTEGPSFVDFDGLALLAFNEIDDFGGSIRI